MFVMYGPIGDGPEWRATRGEVSEDFQTSAKAYAGALRLAAGNKGKLRRVLFPAPLEIKAGEIANPTDYLPNWDKMKRTELIAAIKAGDMDGHLDDIEAGETRKSVLSAITGRR